MPAMFRIGLITFISFLVIPFSSYFPSSQYANATMKHNQSFSNTNNILLKESMQEPLEKRKAIVGAWAPYQTPVEEIIDTEQQVKAIKGLLEKGFVEYYFLMTDLNSNQKEITEKLLTSANNTGLQILIILLPPSEGGPNGNYDWKGWIHYFNNLKDKHKSFKGFTIADFNWISTRNDTKFRQNVDYMTYSNLSEALHEKRKDVNFYPVIYFEGEETDTVIKEYSRFIDGMVMASACYYNITNLEGDLLTFSEMFDNKPIRYVVYTAITYNYSRRNYDSPSDQLIMATLSIASRAADGIVIWKKVDSRIVEDYLSNHQDNPMYLPYIFMMENLQIRDEKIWKQANPSLGNSKFFQRYCHL